MTHSLSIIIVAIIALLSAQALGQTSGKEVVAYFSNAANFASIDVLKTGYTKCMGWGTVPQANCQQTACSTGCALQVACVIADNTLMSQLIDYVANNESSFRECIISYYPSTVASSIQVVAIPDTTNPPSEDDKSFIAKYPYVIAAIAVAVLIAIIVASVLLIQKRANHLAEMDDESMLAEHEAPGWNANNGRRNDLPPSGRSNNGGGGGGGAPRKPSQNPGGKQRQKSAADPEDNPFENQGSNRNINNNSGSGNGRPVSNSQKGGGYQAPVPVAKETSSPADQAATEAPKEASASPTADASSAAQVESNTAQQAAPETAVVHVSNTEEEAAASGEGEHEEQRE